VTKAAYRITRDMAVRLLILVVNTAHFVLDPQQLLSDRRAPDVTHVHRKAHLLPQARVLLLGGYFVIA
jgi:hypothetical protein